MCSFKLLIVEDNEEDLKTCKDTVKRYKDEKSRDIELVECKTLEEALDKVDNSFDGVIIDLKLGPEGNEGNRIIEDVHKEFRIPIAVLTGTPANSDTTYTFIPFYKKGETGYDDILDYFFQIYDTGVTRIFGGRGTIEAAMNKVFWNNIYPQLDSWKSYVGDGGSTEKALLRFTINNLLEFLNYDSDVCYPEEMYIAPPVESNLKTGSIVKDKNSSDYYVVLSPACDLANHNGSFKTDRILVCLIEKYNTGLVARAKSDLTIQILADDDEKTIENKERKKRNAEFVLAQLPRNNYSNYCHYLPKTSVFEGGIINFRKVNTYKPSELKSKFSQPLIQISMAFTKDIVSRFSSYYSRQGQPDFNFDILTEELKRCTLY
jgi:CheY-like chemotaxis protein